MPSERTPTAVIFDLDGTLVQTRMASWEVFRDVSDAHGLGIDTPEQFFALFDGNLYASLQRVCRDEQHAADVKKAMLDALGARYAPWLVPGIADVVRRLASVCTLAVMSSNATSVIRRILSDNDMALCFSHVFGGDVSESKELTIARFLTDASLGPGRRCEGGYDESEVPRPHDPQETVLVTDTVGDVLEANAAGIRAVGVAWGMHSPQDLLDAGAEFVALWPQELVSHLLGPEGSRPPQGACALPVAGACPLVNSAVEQGPTRSRRQPATPKLAASTPVAPTPTAKSSGTSSAVGGDRTAMPCPCGGGHWTKNCPGECGGKCGGGGDCGYSGSTTQPASAAGGAQDSEIRGQRRMRRGYDASAASTVSPAPATSTEERTRTRIAARSGAVTMRELRAAVGRTCQ